MYVFTYFSPLNFSHIYGAKFLQRGLYRQRNWSAAKGKLSKFSLFCPLNMLNCANWERNKQQLNNSFIFFYFSGKIAFRWCRIFNIKFHMECVFGRRNVPRRMHFINYYGVLLAAKSSWNRLNSFTEKKKNLKFGYLILFRVHLFRWYIWLYSFFSGSI